MVAVAVSPSAPADSVTAVATVRTAASSVPVTVSSVAPAFSATVSGVTESVTIVEGLSSSLMVTVAGLTVRAPPVAAPPTLTVSSGSSTRSFTGVRVRVAVPLVWAAAMVRVAAVAP